MTEYLVTELPSKHINELSEAEDMAEELKEITRTPHGVYLLISTYYPRDYER